MLFVAVSNSNRTVFDVPLVISHFYWQNLMIERGSSSGPIFSLMMPGFSGGAKDSPEPASSSQPASQVRPKVDADFQEPAGMSIGLQIPGFLPDQVWLSFAWKPVLRSACNVSMHFCVCECHTVVRCSHIPCAVRRWAVVGHE